jgi:outer membrane biosynthesis protein TonB
MNRSNFALFVALLVHLLLLLTFWVLGSILPEIKKPLSSEEKRIKVSLKELPKPAKKAPPKKKKIIKQPELAPPMVKGSQLKEIVKKPPLKYIPKIKQKTPKLNPKPIKKTKPKKKVIEKQKLTPIIKEKKEVIKQKPKKKELQNSMDWLYEDKAKFEKPKAKIQRSHGSSMGRNIKELYGSTFGELSAAQQEYILDNQEIMRRITQQVLTRQAGVSNLRGLNVNKTNVIEFYLHPNGDMSDFKFLHKSGFFILDEITKVTIEYAYSKYPRPKEKTLIRYNVFYNLNSY